MAAASLDSILSFTRRTTELTADEVREIDGGWTFSTPSIEVAWGLNHVRLHSPVSFARAVAAAEQAQSHLPYRQVMLEHGALRPELDAAFTAAGWKAERDLLMELTNPPDREVDTDAVLDVDERDQIGLARRWTLEEAPHTPAGVLTRLEEFWRREAQARGDRFLGIANDRGRGIAAKAKLRSDGATAQIEDVYTLPEARGRGFGRALVTRAVQLAQADDHGLIFIIADDAGWPKQMYAQIGFQPVGLVAHYHRELRRSPPASQSPRRTAQPST